MLHQNLIRSALAISICMVMCDSLLAQTKSEPEPGKAEEKAAARPTPPEKVKNIVAHPGETVSNPSRRPEAAGIQQGIRRDRMHRADLVNKPTRNYDYSGFNYPRREAGAYRRPIRRYSSYGYPSRNYGNRSYYGGGYYGARSGYRSYNSYRSYGYRSYGYRSSGFRSYGRRGYRY